MDLCLRSVAIAFEGSFVRFATLPLRMSYLLPAGPRRFASGALSCYYAYMEMLRYKPVALWNLDDSSPFQDYSGYSASGTLTGTEKKSIALTSEAVYSQLLQSDTTATFASSVYVAGKESDPFTIACTILPVFRTDSGNQQVVGNTGKMDGITLNGTTISFSTKYTTNGEAKCSYNFLYRRRLDIVAVHTKTKNTLYVNGELVAEVDITEAQQASTYDSPDSNLYSGTTATTQAFMMNGLALYARALSSEEVSRIYTTNNRRAEGDVPKMNLGETLYVSKQIRAPFISFNWSTEDDWNKANKEAVHVEYDQLVADKLDGLTIKSRWTTSVNLYNGQSASTINAANLIWEGENVTVEASVDASTWITVTPGVNLSIIPAGFDPTNKDLYIRATFTENTTSAYIDNMQFNAYLTNTAQPFNGRVITYTNAANFEEFPPLDLRENWGVQITSGSLAFGADSTDQPLAARTVEVWIKKNSAGSITMTPAGTTVSSTFINGNNTTSVGRGEWALYHYVFAANAATFTISGDLTIGRVAIYDTALTSTTSGTVYRNYVGIDTVVTDDGADIQLTEPASSVSIYAHDWEIVAT